jgi:hypothetical protein
MDLGVATYISVKLRLPKIETGLGHIRVLAVRVPMPEAAMNHDNRSIPRQDNVRDSGKIASMQPEPIAQAVQQ